MAHGDREAQRELAALYAGCNALVTLLYQLYFHVVGYRGQYAHFGANGLVARNYPPAKELSPGAAAQHPGPSS